MRRYSVYFNSFFITLLNLGIQGLLWASLIWYFEALNLTAQFAMSTAGILVAGGSTIYFYGQSQSLQKPPGTFYWICVEILAILCCLDSTYILIRCFKTVLGS
jgi:hypothetical protein